MKWTLVALALCCTPTYAGKVYRCEVDGKTVFSQTQCADTYQEIDAKPKKLLSGTNYNAVDVMRQQGGKVLQSAPDRDIEKHPFPWRNDPDGKYKIQQAIAEGKVLIGFTKEEAIQAWGEPLANYQSQVESGLREQLVYRGKNSDCFIIIRNNWVIEVLSDGSLEYQ